MNTLLTLARIQMKRNKKRAFANFLSIAMAAMLVTTLAGLIMGVRLMMRDVIVQRGGNWHIIVDNLTDEQKHILQQDNRVTVISNDTSAQSNTNETRLLLNHHTFSYQTEVRAILSNAGATNIEFVDTSENTLSHASNGFAYHIYTQRALLFLDGMWSGFTAVCVLAALATILLLLAGGIGKIIGNVFDISLSSRVHEVGILRTVGATPKQIAWLIVLEVSYLALVGIPAGVAAGLMVQWVCMSIANVFFAQVSVLGVVTLQMHTVVSIPLLLALVVYVYFISALSAFRPSRKMASLSILQAAYGYSKPVEHEKIVPRKRKMQKPHSVERMLSARSWQQNRRQHRPVIVALSLGIAFFLACAGTGAQIISVAERNLPLDDYNLSVNITGLPVEEMQKVEESLRHLENQQTAMGAILFSANTFLDEGFYTKEAMQYVPSLETHIIMSAQNPNGIGTGVSIRAIDDDSFSALCSDAGVENDIGDMPWGILFNDYTFEKDGSTMSIPLYNTSDDSSITLTLPDAPPIAIATVLPGPSPFYEDRYSSTMKIYMSRTSLSYLSDALIGQTNSYTYRVQALESDRFESDVIKLLERDFNIDSQSVEIHNYASQSASYRTIYALIVFFSTIIVALVILVALSNVFVVVDYNIAVRKKEFAILRSIGMEPKGLERMLTFDSVRYFFLPLLIGIPLGVAPVCAVYLFLRRIFAISFTMPYALILIYVGAFIYMSIFVTMYAICKVKKIKIMETIMRDIND